MSDSRQKISEAKRWVIKLGSALLTDNGYGLKSTSLDLWIEQIVQLRKEGIDVVVVSSGAVAEGISRLGRKEIPHAIHELQAAAAIGQMGLIQAYEQSFKKFGVHTAQVLLTHDDIADRNRYLNARTTLRTLVEFGCVPVVNENDTVATEEIRFGDNDTLAGLVTNLIEADLLVILTDQAGLFDADPRHHPDAKLIARCQAGDVELEKVAGQGGSLGRGGMLTKLKAASMAQKSGADTVIASGLEPDVLTRIARGDDVGTWLQAGQAPLTARKQWLASHKHVYGNLKLDQGAVEVLSSKGKSLLAVGVTAIEGDFRRGEIVACIDPGGKEIARGLVNYNSDEARKIIGHPSDSIETLLGYIYEPELIHRDNLILH